MASRHRSTGGDTWPIVLAGGEGERLGPLVHEWLGRHRPKQYCTFTGSRSMFQHTVDRALQLSPSSRIVVSSVEGHREELADQLNGRPVRATLMQPMNRGTAAGIFLPLAYVKAHDPDATVVLLPSDHFVFPEERFLECVSAAADLASRLDDRIVLLGIEPDSAEREYGWIEPGWAIETDAPLPARAIRRFVEKPDGATARAVMAAGGLWNTFVIAGRVEVLWRLAWECAPGQMLHFEALPMLFELTGELPPLEPFYRTLPTADFSAHIVARAPEWVAVAEARGFAWSDWGRPERILDTLSRMGWAPAFPAGLVPPRPRLVAAGISA